MKNLFRQEWKGYYDIVSVEEVSCPMDEVSQEMNENDEFDAAGSLSELKNDNPLEP